MKSHARLLSHILLGCALLAFASACALNGHDVQARAQIRNFIQPPPGISDAERAAFAEGRALLAKRWTAEEGLGPLFDGRSCLICHPRGGGGSPVQDGNAEADNASMILRFAAPAGGYGLQLQRRTIEGIMPEGQFSVRYAEEIFAFPDGEIATLRTPAYGFSKMMRGETPSRFSVVIAPKIAGSGLIEAIAEADIKALADPEDRNGDGISGRAGIAQGGRLGRFGWRAEIESVDEQVARAFLLDMGLSTHLYPQSNGDCVGDACDDQQPIEVNAQQFSALARFVRMVEPSAPGAKDGMARQGSALFSNAGCSACHRPSFTTGTSPERFLSNRQIWPYSDLLVHDMGTALADDLSSEWRTAPLWGVALRGQINSAEYYLHDGRARTLTEAILWHGGEAQKARDRFVAMTGKERAALLAFLRSL